MNKLYKNNNEHATVCADGTCVTVYGEAARLITSIALCAALIVAIATVVRALR